MLSDPIQLIHRIVAMEVTMNRLSQDCQQLADQRQQVTRNVLESQQRNVNALIQVELWSLNRTSIGQICFLEKKFAQRLFLAISVNFVVRNKD